MEAALVVSQDAIGKTVLAEQNPKRLEHLRVSRAFHGEKTNGEAGGIVDNTQNAVRWRVLAQSLKVGLP